MSHANQADQKLIGILHHIATIDSIGSLLSRDEQAQMPPHAAELRANQPALIAHLNHERLTSLGIHKSQSRFQENLVASPAPPNPPR